MEAKIEKRGNARFLVVELMLEDEPFRESASGKTKIVASTGGFMQSTAKVKDGAGEKTVSINLTATVRP